MEQGAKERLCEELERMDTLLEIKYGSCRNSPEAMEEYAMLSRIALNAYTQNIWSKQNGMGSY